MHKVDLDLLIKYFSGKASPSEALMIGDWMKMNDENQAYFKEIQQAYYGATTIPEIDMHESWQSFHALIQSSTKEPLKKSNYGKRIIIAAATIAVLIISTILFLKEKPTDTYHFQAKSIVKKLTLIDGTEVVLQPSATLSIEINETERKLALKGDGAFYVSNNDTRFIVSLNHGIQVEDIGTKFSVSQSADLLDIAVTEGLIKVWKNIDTYEVAATNMIRYHVNSATFETLPIIANVNFENEELQSVAGKCYDLYGIQMNIHDNIKYLKITLRANDINAQELIDLISQTLDVQYKRDDATVEIYQ